MARVRKTHFADSSRGHRGDPLGRCGADGPINYNVGAVTCRVCMFHILADVAPWAREFLNDLRDQGAGRKPLPVVRPRAAAKPVDRQIECYRAALGSPFRQQAGSQKAIGELLPHQPALWGAIDEVMHNSRPPAEPVGVKPGQVAEDAGNAGQVSDEAFWHY